MAISSTSGLTYNDTRGSDPLRVCDCGITGESIATFRRIILTHYRKSGRVLPWRVNPTPYAVFVSEIMLQQTQVSRVIPKFEAFVRAFPDFNSLASASLSSVLALWQGLGYNRRAVALRESAQILQRKYDGVLPESIEDLSLLPGIGKATASAIAVYAFHRPVVFIETNIRTVFIHFFFPGMEGIMDKQIFPLVEKTLYRRDPSRWYNALMDYGVLLKESYGNPGRRSAATRGQSPFKNSHRQRRGKILRAVLGNPGITLDDLADTIAQDAGLTGKIVSELMQEGFIVRRGDRYRIK